MKPLQVFLNTKIIKTNLNKEMVCYNHTLFFANGSKKETAENKKWQPIGLQKKCELGTILLDNNCKLYHLEY